MNCDLYCWFTYGLEGVSWLFIVLGTILVVIGAIGLVRLPEFWSRLHAASVIESGGTILVLVGLALQAGPNLIAAKLIAMLIFVFITGPTATHAIANAAVVAGLIPPRKYRMPKDRGADK